MPTCTECNRDQNASISNLVPFLFYHAGGVLTFKIKNFILQKQTAIEINLPVFLYHWNPRYLLNNQYYLLKNQ